LAGEVAMAAAMEFLETQGATRPELAEWYAALADLYQRKLWHQLTLKLDQFLALAVVQVRMIPSLMMSRFVYLP
jgi:26S proteasome regulatory subunit N9